MTQTNPVTKLQNIAIYTLLEHFTKRKQNENTQVQN